jgi:predicted metalloprotease
VPLSEHEQRLFDQIERSLAEDPKFASAVRASDPRFHARRRLIVAAVAIIAGLALLVYGTASGKIPLGVAGFVVMLGSAAFAMQSRRKGQQSADLHAVGGTATRRTRQRKSTFLDRLEDRWKQRPEGHR